MRASATVLLAVAAPALAQATWQLAPSPSARYGMALVRDPVRHVTVLYGGASKDPLFDTWEWNGSMWRLVPVTSGPQLGVVFGGVFDPARQQVLVFGTAQPLTPLQVWGFDGAQWTQHASPDPSTPVNTAAMTYDSGRGRIVVNAQCPTIFAWRLWEWDGSAWYLAPILSALWGADTAQMAYDPVRGMCIMLRGHETYLYNGGQWTRTFTSSPNLVTSAYTMTWDPRRQVVVLMGGGSGGNASRSEIWLWSGSAWSFDSATLPDAREAHGACFDETANCLLFVGGKRVLGFTGDAEVALGTWTESAGGWTRRDAANPAPRGSAALALDPVRDRLVLFGGHSQASSNSHCEWDAATGWSERTFGSAPPPRSRHRLVHDAARGQLLLFGGLDANPLADTWTFDGAAWQQRFPAAAPSPRYDFALTWDEDRQVVVLYGGRDASTTYRDTWEWDGAQWQQRVASFPPADARQVLAWDPRRHRDVLITSGSPGPITMWLWDGANWASQAPPVVRPSLTARELVYDRARARLVLIGTGAGGTETWDEDGAAWTLRATDPRLDIDGAVAYDATRARVTFVGGRAGNLAIADVLHYASETPASYEVFGQGCAGSLGVPTLSADGLPWLGDTLAVQVAQVPPSALAIVDSGFSTSIYQGTPLPFDLGALGQPGCQVLVAPDFTALAGGAPQPLRTAMLALPLVPAFAGTELFQQALLFDAATLQISATAGRRARLGLR